MAARSEFLERMKGGLRLQHGHARRGKVEPEYAIWWAMLNRCGVVGNKRGHVDYAGRGIAVCERWRESYNDFVSDMTRRPSPQHSIDRIDNNGNYEPGNCRWATKAEQQANTRHNRKFSYGGETLHIAEWARRRKVDPSTMWRRIERWGLERALTLPSQVNAPVPNTRYLTVSGETLALKA